MISTAKTLIPTAATPAQASFGPFAADDAFSVLHVRTQVTAAGAGGGYLLVEVGDGGAKEDVVPVISVKLNVAGSQTADINVQIPVWQKIQQGRNYITVRLSYVGLNDDVIVMVGPAVRPAFRVRPTKTGPGGVKSSSISIT